MVVEGKGYRRCRACAAVLLEREHFFSPADEHAHYRHHENAVDDPRYRRFLSRLAEPILARLSPRSSGLDYGCGPGPALAAMLGEAGHEMRVYDPFFAPDPCVFERTYDFIVCSETAEHFFDPAGEFERLDRLARPGGWLGFMTCFRTDAARFAAWHYRRDPTHVVFYAEATFRHIAGRFGWTCIFPGKDVALMHKPARRGAAS